VKHAHTEIRGYPQGAVPSRLLSAWRPFGLAAGATSRFLTDFHELPTGGCARQDFSPPNLFCTTALAGIARESAIFARFQYSHASIAREGAQSYKSVNVTNYFLIPFVFAMVYNCLYR
jgi:hypothetical protein